MGNTIMEMRSELSPRRYSPPKKSRVWSIPAVDFAYELQSVDKCGYFDWPLHVWPTTDGKKFIIPIADYSVNVIEGVTCSLVHSKRFDLLEKVHFSIYVSHKDQWKSMSPTKMEGIDLQHDLLLLYLYKTFNMLQYLIEHNDLIEYLERYSTPYLKQFIKDGWDEFLERTEDKLEIRMYLMRYIQDAPQIEEEELNPVVESYLHWRLR